MIRLILAFSLLAAASTKANENNRIPTLTNVELAVGQSIIVNGFRGECGERPKNVDPNRTRDTKLGTLSVGAWGMKRSRTCNGWTPAIEVIFKAKKVGSETIDVNGDNIDITVK